MGAEYLLSECTSKWYSGREYSASTINNHLINI